MHHIVAIDRGKYWDVIADYTGSKVISKMTEKEWKDFYSTSEHMQAMRKDQKGSAALLAKRSVGLWQKDWSAPYVLPPQKEEAKVLKRAERLDKLRKKRQAGKSFTEKEKSEILDLLLGV